jgi:hypothetical protein
VNRGGVACEEPFFSAYGTMQPGMSTGENSREQSASIGGPTRPAPVPVRRWPLVAFVAVAVATAVGLFLTQHLKVSTPFLNGSPRPDPPTFNPVTGGVCGDLAGKQVSYRSTRVGFYLQHRSGRVWVYVLDRSGRRVATLAGSGRYMRAHGPYRFFSWDGRVEGGAIARDGTYRLQVVIGSAPHPIMLDKPVRVLSAAPSPRITAIKVLGQGSGRRVVIDWGPADDRGAEVVIYRAARGEPPRRVKSFGTDGRRGTAVWDATINGRAAAAGRYLVTMRVLDPACTSGRSTSSPAAGASIVTLR